VWKANSELEARALEADRLEGGAVVGVELLHEPVLGDAQAEAEAERDEVLAEVVAALEDDAAEVVDERAEEGALERAVVVDDDVRAVVEVGHDELERPVGADLAADLRAERAEQPTRAAQPVEVAVERRAGDRADLDRLLSLEDVDDRLGRAPRLLAAELDGAVEDLALEGAEASSVLARGSGPEPLDPGLAPGREPAPERPRRDARRSTTVIDVGTFRRVGDRSANADPRTLLEGLENLSEDAVAEGRGLECAVFGIV
jgi:hypothetical protein